MGGKIPRDLYERELYRLQTELVTMQEWVRAESARIVVIFEGRDAAGKGGTIKRVTEYLNPRVARIVALPAPTERERTEWYFQRYTEHLPAAGEIALFDRSWYNRAGVEHVMGFCTKEEYGRFLHQCPIFERLLVEEGILLRKYWFSVSDEEQQRRFRARVNDPVRRWKLSPMDLESITRWEDYSRAKDEMFVHTDIPEAPWYVVESDDKRRARINMISHLLATIPYRDVQPPPPKLPPRPAPQGYIRTPWEMQTFVPDYAQELLAKAEHGATHGKAEHGGAGHGKAEHGGAGHGKAEHGGAGHGKAGTRAAGDGNARTGKAAQDKAAGKQGRNAKAAAATG